MLVRAPIRLRLTLWYVLLLALILAAFAAGVYLVLRQTLYQDLDAGNGAILGQVAEEADDGDSDD